LVFSGKESVMEKLRLRQSSLSGTVSVPASKSHTLRALLLASLADGRSTIKGALVSPDTAAMAEVCRFFGATVAVDGARNIVVDGIAGPPRGLSGQVDVGNSGVTLRFASAVAALGASHVLVTGDASICSQRSMGPLLGALNALGAAALSCRGNGFAPLLIKGKIGAGKVEVDGADSQHVSALLLAGSLAPGPVVVDVVNMGERPWVMLTLDWMARVGLPYRSSEWSLMEQAGVAALKVEKKSMATSARLRTT
jgi:3-phosphoshikimate 1-carboxyvinyltransferase